MAPNVNQGYPYAMAEEALPVIKLMTDFGCPPLWFWGDGPIDPEDLPISSELQSDLWAWAEIYEQILDWNNPADSGFDSVEDFVSFSDTGERLWLRLIDELTGLYTVTHFSQRNRAEVTSPELLESLPPAIEVAHERLRPSPQTS